MGAYLEVNATTEYTTESKRRLQEQVLEMRNAGMSFPQMGRALGVTHKYVYTIYANALNAIIAPGVELLRKQEGERMDSMLIPCMAKIIAARDAALAGIPYETPEAEITLALKISDQRSKIFGLNAPVKTQMSVPNSPLALENLNLASMDSTELQTFRDLLAKATQGVPSGDPDGD